MRLKERLREWRHVMRSFRVSLRASGLYGRSIKLRRAGRNAEALSVARQGLSVLAGPDVRRLSPPESACLLSLTIQVEQLAHQLGAPGASWRDVVDSFNLLKDLPETATGDAGETRRNWLPYFESRLGGSETLH
jgi:hypothetical protein